MIKLLIVDDEYIVLEGIKFIVDKYVSDVEVIGTAQTGREAIEKAMEFKPDIIFMDIRMPGIHGIEAVRQIKERINNIYVVIISAYEHFSYAKEAVNLGVCEYLLKPISKNKVIDVLNKLKREILDKRKAMQREIVLMERINKIIPHMENQLIYSLLFGSMELKDIEFYEEIFEMKINHGYVMIGKIIETENQNKEGSLKNSILKQEFYELFSSQLKDMVPCLIGASLIDRIVAYIPIDKEKDSYDARNNAIYIAERISEKIYEKIKISYKIGLGKDYDIEDFTKSYNEAQASLLIPSEEIITHFEDIAPMFKNNYSYPVVMEKRLSHNILIGDVDGSKEIFEDIFNSIILLYGRDIVKVKSKLVELFSVLMREIPYNYEENDFMTQNFLMNIFKIKNIEELRLCFIDFLNSFIRAIALSREKEMDGLITKAVDYIKENYAKDISLDDVAREINMSYHYFSKFFKDSLGRSFIDYLTQLRIDKSKEFLNDRSMSIKEISYKIGYNDPNYFSRIFKKITGITPSEYRINNKMN
ncbi:response regulator [Paramaledivibacter caminithermalis]|jgi:two-component system response regulator YesN|uniref:Stage 0 sporulation protein A homolog n=1 Tax=Paramaledivibacter caminithermalis (strain DSM 15212 / CIP 107654 / DViRD3) TaxID=1121301 RepID=A0A1M6RX16_PARC5|nr:response regulator [Paramaledivibacter caminithermalis]SHK36827.1 two component transcriptional regulator, AraC family [Paramaledivibacter caminithermalis DSM 15212]